MQTKNEITVLPGDRVVILAVEGDMRYYFGIVKEICIENATRLFAKTKKIRVADMPECATARKWKEDQRAKCKEFLENTEMTPKKCAHPKSIWTLIEFKIKVGQTKQKRLYLNDILRLQKENRLTIITPDKLK